MFQVHLLVLVKTTKLPFTAGNRRNALEKCDNYFQPRTICFSMASYLVTRLEILRVCACASIDLWLCIGLCFSAYCMPLFPLPNVCACALAAVHFQPVNRRVFSYLIHRVTTLMLSGLCNAQSIDLFYTLLRTGYSF